MTVESPQELAGMLFTIARRVGTLNTDQRAELERACRAFGVAAPRLLTAEPKQTVHLLRAGLAICGRMGSLVPAAWPPGNVWSAEPTRVSCEACRERGGRPR